MKTLLELHFLLLLILGSTLTVLGQGSALTYQGRLSDAENPANGWYDLRFTLYDAVAGGAAIGTPVVVAPTDVANGLFTVTLDFGSVAFPGAPRWLEISVRTNGSALAYTTLTPRQFVSTTPYAITARNVPDAAISSAKLVDGSVTTAKLANLSVTTAQLTTGAVTTSKIADGAVTSEKLGPISSLSAPDGWPNPALSIDNDGNVAIGPAIPGRKLAVIGRGDANTVADDADKSATLLLASTAGAGGQGGAVEFGFGAGSFAQSYFAAIKGLGRSAGDNTLGDLAFYTRNAAADSTLAERLIITCYGGVGIGTSTPSALLDVATSASSGWVRIVGDANRERFVVESRASPVFQAGAFRGTTSNRAATLGGDALGYFQAGGFDGTVQRYNQARIVAFATENHTPTAQGARLDFQTTPNGQSATGIASRMTIDQNGNVGVGTTAPATRLDVSAGSGQALVARFSGDTTAAGQIALGSRGIGDGGLRPWASIGGVNISTGDGRYGSLLFSTRTLDDLTEKMRIDPFGNVGIGTPSPQGLLDLSSPGCRIVATVPQSLIAEGQVNGGAIYLGPAGLPGSATAGIEATWGSGLNPQLGIGVVRDGAKANILMDFLGQTSIRNGTDPILQVNADHTVTIDGRFITSGAVGIGTGNPTATLHVAGSMKASGPIAWSSSMLTEDQGGAIELGNSTQTGATPYLDFHRGVGALQDYDVRLINDGDQHLSLLGNLTVTGTTTTKVLEITGGADVAEPFPVAHAAPIEPGMVLAIDPNHPGALCLADSAYDRKVAGIASGANGVNPGLTLRQDGTSASGDLPVALSGRVYCWCDASYGPIEPGDLLTTSDTPGHAMAVEDHARAGGAVLGKAMTSLREGRGLVLVLVSLQ